MTKHKSNRKRIALIAAILVVAGLGVWYATRPKAVAPKVGLTATTDAKVNTDEANKNDPTLNKKTASTTTPAAQSTNLSITVNRPVSGDTLPLSEGIELRSTVSGATSGACILTGSGPSGKTFTKNTTIAAQSSYGSCSFDVPGSELAAGEWNLTLSASSGNGSGKTTLKVTMQ
jgi:hypothetical protein